MPKAEDGETFEEYKISKREAKRLLVKSKRKLYWLVLKSRDTGEGEKNV